jgi:hypothetical protein
MHAPSRLRKAFSAQFWNESCEWRPPALRLINKSLASKILPALPQTSGVKSQRFVPAETPCSRSLITGLLRTHHAWRVSRIRWHLALPQSKSSRPIVSYVAACFVALPYATDTAVPTDFLMSYLIVPLARPFPVHMHPLSFVAPILNRATTSRWQGKDYSPLRLPSTRL